MAKAIFNVFQSLLLTIANIFLLPLNTILTNFFPDVSNLITNFTTGVGLFINEKIAWFAYMIPPWTLIAIKVYLAFLIGYYTISFTAHAIIYVLKIVKKLPFA